ncbi:MAG: SGNH/GDSL hydrolase family protein [Eubacterium sp.]|nr:SGNH/GDSL hydrolase family protein [Eubacterium sp.]
MKKSKKIIISLLTVLIILSVAVAFIVMKNQGMFSKGNDEQYSVSQTESYEKSPIKNKTVIFLGSSVTYGATSKGESFVDYLEKRDGIIPVKEAVSGTTLVDNGESSYVARLKSIDTSIKADAFICQLSTNDATKKKPLGEISDSFNIEDFDTKTIAGSIEYIIAYAKNTWDCPIAFYTGTRYDSERYEQMVLLLYQIAEKWHIDIIDLWGDEDMQNVTKEDYKLYMVNGIHPSRAGYQLWWTPKFEAYLYSKIL